MTDATPREPMEAMNARNARVQARYDELMLQGKHGHYETLFRVVREEVESLRQSAATPEASAEPIGILYRGEGGAFRIDANMNNLHAIYAFPPGEHSLYAAPPEKPGDDTGERIAAPVQAGMVLIPRELVMQCTGNEGGYKAFRCLACGSSDWEANFKHKKKCPMIAAAPTKESAPTQQGVTPSDEEIEEIAEQMEASDPKDSFWKEFARAVLSASTSKAACVEPLAQKSEGEK